MVSQKRRTLLKATISTGLVCVAASAGLLSAEVVVATWPEKAFNSKNVNNAVSSLLGSAAMVSSDLIKIVSPSIAESGAEVGVAVSTTLLKVDSINIFIGKNPTPLAVNFNMDFGSINYVRTRVKIAKSCDIHAVVRSEGKLFTIKRSVKVTLGGCGG